MPRYGEPQPQNETLGRPKAVGLNLKEAARFQRTDIERSSIFSQFLSQAIYKRRRIQKLPKNCQF